MAKKNLMGFWKQVLVHQKVELLPEHRGRQRASTARIIFSVWL